MAGSAETAETGDIPLSTPFPTPTDREFSRALSSHLWLLLEKATVGATPGVGWAKPGERAVRFSYASDEETSERQRGGWRWDGSDRLGSMGKSAEILDDRPPSAYDRKSTMRFGSPCTVDGPAILFGVPFQDLTEDTYPSHRITFCDRAQDSRDRSRRPESSDG